jgi:hypothetical protein
MDQKTHEEMAKKCEKKKGTPLRRALVLVTLRHTGEPVNEDGSANVEEDVDPHEAKVAPGVIEVTVDRSQEGVGVIDLAPCAFGGGAVVQEIATIERLKGLHVLETGGVVRRSECNKFDCFAVGSCTRDTGRQHGGDEIGEWRNTVHEDPETRKLARAGQDTTEDQAQGEEQVGQVTTCFCKLDTSDNHVGEGGGKEEEGKNKQEHERSTFMDSISGLSVPVESNRVVPANENQDGHERVPWKLNNNVGSHKGLP